MAQLIFPQNNNDAKRLAKLVNKGGLKRIRQGIYTDAPWQDIPQLVHNQWHEIVHVLYPNAIVSHSTAALLKPINNVVHITDNVKVRRKVTISDALIINIHPGNTSSLTQPFLPTLFRSAPARYLLENLQITHKNADAPKALGQEWVEQELCKLFQRHGEKELNQIRDDARAYSQNPSLPHPLKTEFTKLNNLISAILSTHSIAQLNTPLAIAIAKKEPYDQHRLSLFNTLANYLQQCEFPARPYTYNKANWRNLSFFESYFSNYLEGIEFEIDEAEQIVFEKQEIDNRHQDSHDVLSVFDVVNDFTEMCTLPESPEELIDQLKQRHSLIMHARPNKRPGQFKHKPNKAGSTLFVLPENIEGTLSQAFTLYQQLPPGMPRAIFIQFVVVECHPFDDGNGRLARIMMNAELVAENQYKIILPTVHHDSYLNGLRQASRSGRFRTIAKVFTDLQAYTSTIQWQDYGEARQTLEQHCADKLPDDGVAVFNKQLAKFKSRLPVG